MSIASKLPMVLLPGMDGSGELLAEFAGILSSQRPVRVIAYPTMQPLDYAALAAFAARQLPEGRCAVLGESFSGPIAIELATAKPDQIRALILAATFVRSPLPAALASLARFADPRWLPKKGTEALMLGKYGTPELRTSLHRLASSLPREVLKLRAIEALRVDKREQFRAIVCPTLYLRGRADRIIRKKCLDEIIAIQPATTVRTFDAPHMLLQTHAREAADAINLFCQAHEL